jgi:chorismate synthase
MSSAALAETPSRTIDTSAVRAALSPIPGIERVVLTCDSHGDETIWVVRGDHDIDRDRRIVETMVDVDVVDYHLVPAQSAGMVPEGRTIL